MLDIRTSTSATTSRVGGRAVETVQRQTVVELRGRWFASRWAYRRPVRVSVDGVESVPIVDHVMLVRLLAVSATAGAMLMRRKRR